MAHRDGRIDSLKTIAILLVVIWHFQPIVEYPSSEPVVRALDFLLSRFYLNVSLIGVPLFILVSLYLFIQRNTGWDYQIRRVSHLMALYAGGTLLQTAIGYDGSEGLTLENFPYWQGGLGLPIVGGSVFYFFSVLIALTIICALLYSKERSQKYGGAYRLIDVLLVFVLLGYFETRLVSHGYTDYWRLENFLVYVPLAHLLLENKGLFDRYRGVLPVLFLLSLIHETIVLGDTSDIPSRYLRPSLVFGCVGLFLYRPDLGGMNKVFGEHTLSIFALHKYVFLVVFVVLETYFLPYRDDFGVFVFAKQLIVSIVAFIGTIFLSQVVSRAVEKAARSPRTTA